VVQTITNVTAAPNPAAVSILLEQTRKEHNPRKFARSMLFVNIEAINIVTTGVVFT